MEPFASVTKLSPTASVRDVDTTSGWFTVAIPPTVAIVTGAFCALWQGSPAAGTTIVSDVGDAATTAAVTPAIVTAFDEGPRNPLPAIVAVAPGESDAGVMDAIVGGTDQAGATTTTASDPEMPSLVAVSVAAPGLSATSCPNPSTVATRGADELKVTRRPDSAAPLPSVTTTTSGVLVPATGDVASGAMDTAATGG